MKTQGGEGKAYILVLAAIRSWSPRIACATDYPVRERERERERKGGRERQGQERES
jgi:hypothetical protein